MQKCPFCAEEIQDDAKKCKHCNEWLSENPQASASHNQNSANSSLERILCEDGNCIGVLDQRGICKDCGRSPAEVRAGVENKNPTPEVVFQPIKHNKSSSGKWISCPQCRGKATGGRGCLIIGLIVITFPIGLLFLLVKPTYACQSCGYRFKV